VRNSAFVLFKVTANYLFSKYRLRVLIIKIPASAKLAVRYRPGRWSTGHLATLTGKTFKWRDAAVVEVLFQCSYKLNGIRWFIWVLLILWRWKLNVLFILNSFKWTIYTMFYSLVRKLRHYVFFCTKSKSSLYATISLTPFPSFHLIGGSNPNSNKIHRWFVYIYNPCIQYIGFQAVVHLFIFEIYQCSSVEGT